MVINSTSILTSSFFIRKIQHKSEQVNMELWREAQLYGDIQLMPFVDYYSLITFKTISICMFGVCSPFQAFTLFFWVFFFSLLMKWHAAILRVWGQKPILFVLWTMSPSWKNALNSNILFAWFQITIDLLFVAFFLYPFILVVWIEDVSDGEFFIQMMRLSVIWTVVLLFQFITALCNQMKQSVKTRVGLFSFSQFYVFHTSLGSFISYGSLKKLPRKRTGCLKVEILPAPSIPLSSFIAGR